MSERARAAGQLLRTVKMSRLIVGCGYLGHRLAKQWKLLGDEVHVTTRDAERARRFLSEGLSPILIDVTSPSLPDIPDIDVVTYCVGYDRRTPHTIEEVYVNGLTRFLNAIPSTVQQFIYISSTGVYGQTDGEWVDELSTCQPVRDGGKACLAAEKILRKHWLGQRATILRLAGIYGPGRVPQQKLLQKQEPMPVAADGFLNLIHVDDAVNVVTAAANGAPSRLYTVSDGNPAKRREYYEYLADLLGTARPIFAAPIAGSSKAERARGDKRVRNEKMLQELSVTLDYPSYREGLDAILRKTSD